MKTTAFISSLLASLMVSVLAVPVSEQNQVEERQFIEEIIISAIIGAGSGALKGLLGPEQPLCGWANTHETDNFWARATHTVDGEEKPLADICWTQGGYKFNDNDAAAGSCLTELHANQKTTCIDLDGSSCDFPQSAVGNVRVMWDLATNNDQQLGRDDANKVKDLLPKLPAAMADKGWDISTTIQINPMWDDGTSTSWTISLRGTGDADC